VNLRAFSSEQSLGSNRRKNPSAVARHVDSAPVENPVNRGREMTYDRGANRRNDPSESSSNGASTSSASADTQAAVGEGDNSADLMPLKLLLEVLNSTKASAAIKVKVASATLPYTHPRRSKRNATPKNVADRLGFVVDSKRLRNEITSLYTLKKRRNPRPQELKGVQRTSGKNPCETFDAGVPLPVAI
jgi:hypothetical protein